MVKNYIKNCEMCKRNKITKYTKEKLIVTPTPAKTFDIVQFDTVGPFPITENGNKFILSIIDELSSYLILIPVKDKSALTVAKTLLNNVVLLYGPMKVLKSDQGTEICNEVMNNICKLLHIERSISTAYHHETVGKIEKSHRDINSFLRNYMSLEKPNWDEILPIYSFCYNTTPNPEHLYSPFEIMFGKTANIMENIGETFDPIYNIEDYSKIIKFQLQIAQNKVKKYLESSKAKMKAIYDKKSNPQTLKVGEKVFLKNEIRNKLDSFYNGPHIITKLLENNNVEIKINDKLSIVHKNRLIKS